MNDKHSQAPPEALGDHIVDANKMVHTAYGNGNVRIYKGWVQQLCDDGKWRLLPEVRESILKLMEMAVTVTHKWVIRDITTEDEIEARINHGTLEILGPDVLEADE